MPRDLRAKLAELREKTAVSEYVQAQQRSAPRVAGPPAKTYGDRAGLSLQNIDTEVKRRYPGLKWSDAIAQTSERLREGLKGQGGDPSKIRIDMGPGKGGSHASARRVQMRGANPYTLGHELGHVVDQQRGIDMGERGFFGIGMDAESAIPSEVSATRQALRAVDRSPAEKARMLAATGTYMQAAEEYGSPISARRRAYDSALHSAAERAGRPALDTIRNFEAQGRIAKKLEPALDRRGRIHDTLDKQRVKEKALRQELSKKYGVDIRGSWVSTAGVPRDEQEELVRTVKADPLWRRAQRYEAASRRYYSGDGPAVPGGPTHRSMTARERMLNRILEQSRKIDQQAEAARAPNPFIDPLWEKMTPGEQKDTLRYIDDLGDRLGAQFGDEYGELYKQQMRHGLENPTRARFEYMTPPRPATVPTPGVGSAVAAKAEEAATKAKGMARQLGKWVARLR